MYATEKSLWRAAQTRAKAAPVTAIQVAMPARRAVSASLSLGIPTTCRRRATAPNSKQYALRTSARRSAKLPNRGIVGMGNYTVRIVPEMTILPAFSRISTINGLIELRKLNGDECHDCSDLATAACTSLISSGGGHGF